MSNIPLVKKDFRIQQRYSVETFEMLIQKVDELDRKSKRQERKIDYLEH
jgi:hypothetical protein